MSNKPIADVICKGRIPGTSRKCENVVYQSDGEFLFVRGFRFNEDLDLQRVKCLCGYTMVWKRNQEFINKSKSMDRRQRRSSNRKF